MKYVTKRVSLNVSLQLIRNNGYHQVRADCTDVPGTAIQTRHRQFEYSFTIFRLAGALVCLQTLLSSVLLPHLDMSVLAYLEDIPVYGKSKLRHFVHLQIVPKEITENKPYSKMSNCEFLKSRIQHLGLVITERGIQVNKVRITSVSGIVKYTVRQYFATPKRLLEFGDPQLCRLPAETVSHKTAKAR